MSSVRCQNCQVVNWSTSELCIRCQAPLNQKPGPPISRNKPRSGPPDNNQKSSIPGLAAALGIIVFLVSAVAAFFIVNPLAQPSKPTTQQIGNQTANPAPQPGKNDPGIPGVPPLNLSALEQEVLTATRTNSKEPYRVIYKDATGKEIKDWQLQQTCYKEFSSITSQVHYEKVDNEVVAAVSFEVKGTCGPVDFFTPVSRRYVRKEVSGFDQWVYDPGWDSRKNFENEIKQAQQNERERREKALEKEERKQQRQLAREEEGRKNWP